MSVAQDTIGTAIAALIAAFNIGTAGYGLEPSAAGHDSDMAALVIPRDAVVEISHDDSYQIAYVYSVVATVQNTVFPTLQNKILKTFAPQMVALENQAEIGTLVPSVEFVDAALDQSGRVRTLSFEITVRRWESTS